MFLPNRPAPTRRGLSLMEVLVALTIFLLSFVALAKLVTLSSDQAVEVQYRSEAAHMAQSKLNEVLAGSLPLSSQNGTIDEDPEWQWSVDAEQAGVASLWTVKVRVWRQYEGHELDATLSQMVMDPSVRGSMFDQIVVTGSQDTASTNSGSSTGSNTGSNGGGNSSSQGQQGAGAGATMGGGGMTGGGMTGGKTGGTTTTPNTGGKTGGTTGPTTTTPNTGGKTGGTTTPAPNTGGKTGGTTTGGKTGG